jgi:hypothetical protein
MNDGDFHGKKQSFQSRGRTTFGPSFVVEHSHDDESNWELEVTNEGYEYDLDLSQ